MVLTEMFKGSGREGGGANEGDLHQGESNQAFSIHYENSMFIMKK